jgi:hypothetical protein
MKVSEWLRKYQITGAVPDEKGLSMDSTDAVFAFWCGWLMRETMLTRTIDDQLAMAIRAAEFIEAQK